MNSSKPLTGGGLLFEVLEQHGVEHVFGYPGGAIMPIYDALYDSNVKHFLCRHEQGAAFSAVGYARAAGKVGVCMATSGPGATNLITGLADALADSIPVVAITGQVATSAMGSDAFQEIDIFGLSLACTKHSFQVSDINDLEDVLHQAFEIALEGRQGPVLVDIPKDIQQAQVTSRLEEFSHLTNKVQLPLADISSAIDILTHAKQPILYVGGGVGMANAIDEVRSFAEQTGMPSVSTLKGLGAINADNENYMGMLGMHGTKASNLAVQECDLLVVVGARFDDRVTGKLNEFAPNAKVIHFDIDTAEINKRRFADAAILGDLKANLPLLSMSLNSSEWQAKVKQMKADFGWRYDHPGSKIFAPAVLKEMSDLILTTWEGSLLRMKSSKTKESISTFIYFLKKYIL